MIVVGYVYGYNGMASWCLELARVIHNSGRDVLLIVSPSIADVPNDIPIFVYPSDVTTDRGLVTKVVDKIRKYFQVLPLTSTRQDWIVKLDISLRHKGIKPKGYLLNQSNFFNSKLSVPQYVAAWADPPFFKDYMHRAFKLNTGGRNIFSELCNAVYWYKSDWFAYRYATATLPVSELLGKKLRDMNCNVHVLHPPLVKRLEASQFSFEEVTKFGPLRIALMSLYIDDPRKGYLDLIKKFEKWSKKNSIVIDLIGGSSLEFRKVISDMGIEFSDHGLLPRDVALRKLSKCDIFLFASNIDDWGFVQVEAMSMGIPILSPNLPLNREIIGDSNFLFDLVNESDFINKLNRLVSRTENILLAKKYFLHRYNTLYSGSRCIEVLKSIRLLD